MMTHQKYNVQVSRSQEKTEAAFTLIEMLVVIAIIGLLTSLVVPAVSGAMERAQSVRCSSNLRSLGQGIMGWSAEKNGRLPNVNEFVRDGSSGNHNRWYVRLGQDGFLGVEGNFYYYNVEKAPVLICPTTRKDMRRTHTGHFDKTPYAMNGWFGGIAGGSKKHITVDLMRNPSGTVLVAESFLTGGVFLHPISSPSQPYRAPSGPHRGNNNVLFGDGSVRQVPREHLVAGLGTRETEGGIWRFY